MWPPRRQQPARVGQICVDLCFVEEEEDKIGEKFRENWEEKLRLQAFTGKIRIFRDRSWNRRRAAGEDSARVCLCVSACVCAFMKIVGHRRGSPVPWSREDRPRKRGQKMVPGTKWHSKGNDQSGLHGQ